MSEEFIQIDVAEPWQKDVWLLNDELWFQNGSR